MEEKTINWVEEAIKLAGGVAAVMTHLNIRSPNSIYDWMRNEYVPIRKVGPLLELIKDKNHDITPQRLNHDIPECSLCANA